MLRIASTALLAALLFAAAPARAAEPANTIHDLLVQMNRCLASVQLPPGADVTVRFMLNRRGGLIGKPRITHAQWPRDATDRAAAASAIAHGFDHCLPAAITDALGGAIAGRIVLYRFRGAARGDKV